MFSIKYFGFALVLAPFVAMPSCNLRLVTLSPTSLHFSNNVVGTTSAAQTITVRNAGTVAVQVTGISSSGLYSETNNCPSTLPAKATCTILVRFAPNAVGHINGAVQVTTPSVIPKPPLVSLYGTGIAPLTFSSASLSFGTVAVGTSSAAQSVTLANNLSHAVSVSSVATSADYSQTNNCPSSLGPGTNCKFLVTFHPTASQPISGALTIATSTSPGTQPLGLSGVGSGAVTSNVSLSPANLSFGKQEAGTTSPAESVTLTNTSATSSLTIFAVSSSAHFIAGGSCTGKMIPPGGSCAISVSFHPTANLAPLAYPGAITIVDSDGTSPQAVGLSGTGVAPIAASTGSLNFGTILSGQSSPAQTVTLTNKHTTAETLSIVASREYLLTSNGCTAAIPPAGQCSFQVTFSPYSLGIISGAATINTSSGGFLNPLVVSLLGCSSNSTLLPTKLNFGNESIGITSAPLTATLYAQNPITISGISIAGKNDNDFSISNNTCATDLGGTASCTVSVTFTSAALGPRSGVLSVSDSGGCSPQQVSLAGTGT